MCSLILLYLYSACSFYSRILRLPHSPLFPYTTLFRSIHLALEVDQSKGPVPDPADAIRVRTTRSARRIASAGSGTDRKSTRLNSSHRCISYAVFCLKKKKKINKYNHCTNCIETHTLIE